MTYDYSTSRTELVGRDGRPHECVNCKNTDAHDFIRVHIVRSASIHNIAYSFPCYWTCNVACARQAATDDLATGLVNFR